MRNFSIRIGVLVVALSVFPRLAGAAVIDFESLILAGDAALDVVTSQFSPDLTFTNAIALVADITLNQSDFPPASGTNVVADSGGPMRIDFDPLRGALSFGGFFTYTTTLTLEAFDFGDVSLGAVSSVSSSNLGANEELSLAFADMAYVIVTGLPDGFSFTLDNLTYELGEIGSVVVPEPGTLGLMTFGAVGALLAKRRSRTALRRSGRHGPRRAVGPRRLAGPGQDTR